MDQEKADKKQVLKQDDEGRVELSNDSLISASPAYNHDLAPVPIRNRYWNSFHFAALWAGMACNIPSYMMASGLIADGMTWWQALLAILLGNIIVLLPILLNSHAGTKYGIPFPVLVRASYGIKGSNLPALMRALVACGWFGINAWIGGQALFTLIKALVPGWKILMGSGLYGHSGTEWLSFLAFWALNMLVIYRGMDFLKRFESLAAPFVLSLTAILSVWICNQAHGFGALFNARSKYQTVWEFIPVFVPAVTAMIGSWSTLSLNMPDFTRFARSQKDQIIGQISALPLSMTAFAGMGALITSAGAVLYPHMKMTELWDPVTLVGQFDSPLVVAIAMFTIMLATLSVNIAANLVSPANDLANCFPRLISFRKGALITGICGLLIQPWRLLEDPHAYIFTWLLGYAGGLAAIAGVMICDYWIIRKKTLDLVDLYLLDGCYKYSSGWNWPAVIATGLGCAVAWIGLLYSPLKILYDYSWFAALAVSGLSYTVMMRDIKNPGSI